MVLKIFFFEFMLFLELNLNLLDNELKNVLVLASINYFIDQTMSYTTSIKQCQGTLG